MRKVKKSNYSLFSGIETWIEIIADLIKSIV